MDSAYAKLGRARAHCDALRASVMAYRDREPHEWSSQQAFDRPDPNESTMTVRVHIKEAIPDDWSLIIGDILTNLRAVLDHAVYGHAAARASAMGTPLTKRQERELNYPIIRIATYWPNRKAAIAPLLDPAVMAVIEQKQPFNAPDPDRHPITVLNGLVNRDKHRAMRTVAYVNDDFEVAHSEAKVVDLGAPPVEMTEGAVIATAVLRQAPPKPPPPGFTGSGWRRSPLAISNEFVEKIEAPPTGDAVPMLACAARR
jgi:hypothetical protein